MFHACDIEVSSILNELTEFVTPLAGIHKVVEASGVFSKGTYVELRLLLNLILNVAHKISNGRA